MKKKLLIKETFLLVFLLALLPTFVSSYPVVSKHIDACSKGFFGGVKCSRVFKDLTVLTMPDGSEIVGWSIDCAGAGSTTCPNHLVYQPGAGADPVDVNQANELLAYAVTQVDLYDNLTGEHSVTVAVAGETELRIYKVVWNFSSNNNTSVSGDINVDRIQ